MKIIIIVGILESLIRITLAQNILISEIMSLNVNSITDFKGETSDWIEIYNNDNIKHNLHGFYLTDDKENLKKWSFPNIEIPSHEYLLIWASGKDIIYSNGEIHTNFKIKSSGEKIYLVKPDGISIIDQSPSVLLLPDISLGRKPPSSVSDWVFFKESTPGNPNKKKKFFGIVPAPEFSVTSGLYEQAISLIISAQNRNDIIKYTLDGSEPTVNSISYSVPILINRTTIVRAKVFREGYISANSITNSYIYESNLNLDVILLTTASGNLWGKTGIYTNYRNGEEKPVHVEYLKHDGEKGFQLNAGIKIHGADGNRQKSFRLYARKRYGVKSIDYKIFKEKDISHFKCLVLRNGGNDGAQLKKTHIRDAFSHRLFFQINPQNAVAAYLPVHVFINGSYYGIYNLRERQDEYYIEDNFGYKAEEIDYLEYDYAKPDGKNTLEGDWNGFNSLKTFVTSSNMANESNFQVMDNWMDMDNFIDYQILEIFVGNQDWLNNNVKFWRPKASGGKWKWVLWDTDYGLGAYRNYPIGHPDFNFFRMAMTWGGWGKNDCTWLLRNLMKNNKFKEHFVLRTLDLLNTVFLPDYAIKEFNSLAEGIASDIQKQFDKWGSSRKLWENDLDYTRDYLNRRADYFRKHIAEELKFNAVLFNITVHVNNGENGLVKVNSILIDRSTAGISDSPYPWTGKYFKDIPVRLEAIPEPGKKFLHWEGASSSTDSEILLSLNGNTEITAVFEEVTSSKEIPSLSNGDIQVHIFPVPAKDNMTIRISNLNQQQLKIQIYSIIGNCLLVKDITGQPDLQFDINVLSYESGMYILKLSAKDGVILTKKFIVQH